MPEKHSIEWPLFFLSEKSWVAGGYSFILCQKENFWILAN